MRFQVLVLITIFCPPNSSTLCLSLSLSLSFSLSLCVCLSLCVSGIMDFTNRIKKKHPGCELLPPKVNPTADEHLNAADKMFLQISKVTAADPGNNDRCCCCCCRHTSPTTNTTAAAASISTTVLSIAAGASVLRCC